MSDRTKVILAFATVYLVWGSTYLAIKVGLETLPPFLMAGTRFLVAGTIMAIWSKLRGDGKATRKQWFTAGIVGLLLLLGGNGGVTWAETRIASGLAALLIAVEPVWIVLLEWAMGRRREMSFSTLLGLALGLVGVAVLVMGRGGMGPTPLIPALAVLLSALAWAYGSLYGQKADLPSSPVQTNAMQMLIGGGALALVGLGAGEGAKLQHAHVSWASLGALAYLTIFGSLMAFSAYVFLLRKSSPTMLATYSYVNPAVAVLLGSFMGESLGSKEGLAMALILLGLVVLHRGETAARSTAAEPATEEVAEIVYPREAVAAGQKAA